MNIALPALILLFIFLPGPIFVYTYKGRLRNQNAPLVSASTMTMGWVVSLIVAPTAHVIWGTLSPRLTGYTPDLPAVVMLIGGNYDDAESFQRAIGAFASHPYLVFFYFFSLYVAAAACGLLLHWVIRYCKLDTKFGVLRFNNDWHYLFAGGGVDGALVSASVGNADHSCLYVGIMGSFSQLADGALDRIVLRAPVYRFSLLADPSAPETSCEVPGDHLVIWAKDINTLNIDYLFTSEPTPVAPSELQTVPAA